MGQGFTSTFTSLGNLAIALNYNGSLAPSVRILGHLSEITDLMNEEQISRLDFYLASLKLHLGTLDWQSEHPRACIDAPDDFEGSQDLIRHILVWQCRFSSMLRTNTLDTIRTVLSREDIQNDRYNLLRIKVEEARYLQEIEEHRAAQTSFIDAIRMGREQDIPVSAVEARYGVTLIRLSESASAQEIADRLSESREPPYLRLAELWLELGEAERARYHVRLAYPKAWADGPPYAFHWDLEDCRKVMAAINEPEPTDLPYNTPESIGPFEWEADFLARIEKERTEKREREKHHQLRKKRKRT